jgi:RHS repeat-associated protein
VTDEYDFLARKLHSKQGRWISPDPLGLGAANPTNPQSWNRYAYVTNDPLSGTDPDGLDGSGDGKSCEDVDACGDLIYSGDTSTISSTAYTSSGSLGSGMFIPWGNFMAGPVFKSPVLAQAGKTMNAVTAMYAAGFAGGGTIAAGGALGVGTAAKGLYLIYGTPLVTTMACAEFCSGMSLGSAGASALSEAESGAASSVGGAAETPFAMGLDSELDSFAQARGATTWKQFPNPENWKSGVLDKLADPHTPVHFNLNGVDVWGGVQRAATGRGGATDWELFQIRQNPQFWNVLTFWRNGQVAPNPFK